MSRETGTGTPGPSEFPSPLLDPNEWNGASSIISTAIALTLATLAVGLRFWARAGILRVVALEDWFILASLAFSVACTICWGLQFNHGLGKHVVYVSMDDLMVFFEISLATSITYVLSMTFTKLSVLCLYIRVLTYDHVRRAAKVMLGVVVVSHVYILACLFTACVPLEAFWNLDPIARSQAYCHPISIYWSHAGLNIVTDFLIFLLPLTVIHKIRSPRPQKVALVIIFLLAFVVCIISVVRVILLARDVDAGAMDVTYDSGKTANWNIWEVNIAILCACLTTMKPVVSEFFPKLLSPNPSTMPDSEDISAENGPRGGRRQYEVTGLSTVEDLEVGERRESKAGEKEDVVSEGSHSLEEVAMEPHAAKW
ncbi:hypothetical protein B0T16DRAFT_457210 [Cercophora newfieldiana]|uniref:Rhodopsin domain-containing protein n=1 Tax=Cercophora newfieldiana TaxID=92897 RepID=A0AA40CSG4_9PEZI|nr:hypothetical protein B0T16DRAFT_457210 [Cercophora newfieldiana]